MTTRGRIVCATDLTARSDFALRRAVLLAQQTGARLTLVHAVDPRGSERQRRAQVNRAYVQLLSKVDQAFGSAAAAIDVVVRAGGRLDVIVEVANEVECRPGRAGGAAATAARFDFRHDRRASVARDQAAGARGSSTGARQLSPCCNGGGSVEHVATADPGSRATRRSRRRRDDTAARDCSASRRHVEDRRRGRAGHRRLQVRLAGRRAAASARDVDRRRDGSRANENSSSGREPPAVAIRHMIEQEQAGAVDDRRESMVADQAAAHRQRHGQRSAHGDVRRTGDSAGDFPAPRPQRGPISAARRT